MPDTGGVPSTTEDWLNPSFPTDQSIVPSRPSISQKNIVQPPTVRDGVTAPALDFTKWKDKPRLLLNRETFERNLEDIAPKHEADQLKEFITMPVRRNEADRVKFLNQTRTQVQEEVVKKLGIRAGSKEGARVSVS